MFRRLWPAVAIAVAVWVWVVLRPWGDRKDREFCSTMYVNARNGHDSLLVQLRFPDRCK